MQSLIKLLGKNLKYINNKIIEDIIIIKVESDRKFIYKNSYFSKTTFAKTFDYISSKSKKTKIFKEESIKLSICSLF